MLVFDLLGRIVLRLAASWYLIVISWVFILISGQRKPEPEVRLNNSGLLNICKHSIVHVTAGTCAWCEVRCDRNKSYNVKVGTVK